MLLRLARHLKEPYRVPKISELYKLAELREESAFAHASIVAQFGCEKSTEPYLDLYEFRSGFYRYMKNHKRSLELRNINPRQFRAKNTELESRASINSTDGLFTIKKDNPITMNELVDHMVMVHAHIDNLVPVGISTLDYEILGAAPTRVKEIALSVIFNAYLQVYEFDRDCISNDRVAPLFTHQTLRILTYVGGLLYGDNKMFPALTDFEEREKQEYGHKIQKIVHDVFDLSF